MIRCPTTARGGSLVQVFFPGSSGPFRVRFLHRSPGDTTLSETRDHNVVSSRLARITTIGLQLVTSIHHHKYVSDAGVNRRRDPAAQVPVGLRSSNNLRDAAPAPQLANDLVTLDQDHSTPMDLDSDHDSDMPGVTIDRQEISTSPPSTRPKRHAPRMIPTAAVDVSIGTTTTSSGGRVWQFF